MNKDGRDRLTPAAGPEGMSRRRFLGLTGLWTGALTLGRLVGTRRGHRQARDPAGTAPATRAQHFVNQLDRKPPFSFRYGGRPSAPLLARWPRTHQRTPLDASRTEHAITWTDPRTGLAVRCLAIAYHAFPTVEWTLYFKNTGARPTLP